MKFDKKKFDRLAKEFTEENTKISIFIPTDRVGDGQAAKIRLKNQLSTVTDKLMDESIQEKPMSKNEAMNYLSKAYDLLDNDDFWIYLSDGLVIFISENTFEYYLLPIDFKVLNYVGSVFYMRPMLPAITDKDRFFILALSQNEVKFFEASNNSITPVIIHDLVPQSLEESMAAIDIEYPAQLQSHSGGGNGPIFHGQGGEKDGKDDRIIDYFRMVDEGLMKMLHDERAPLIIAAVDYLVPMYKEISNYSNIVDVHISGNVENDDPTLLHEKAYIELKDILNKDFTDKQTEARELLPQNKASLAFHDIIPATLTGKVDTLFIDKDASEVWGTYQEETNSIQIQDKQNKTNSCLLNFAAVSTYLQSGTVYNIDRTEMPHVVSNMNAIYRY